jgi:hypothetical protein
VTGSWPAVLSLVAAAGATWPRPAMFGAPTRSASADRIGPTAKQRRALLVGIAVLAVALVAGWWPWWLAALLSGAAGSATLPLPIRVSGARRTADRHLLAVHADLLAACLDAGMPIGAALLAVRSTRRPDTAQRAHDPPDPLVPLDGVAALLMLGTDPAKAWATVAHHGELAALAAAASRSSAGGTTLADAVRQHAVALRAAMAEDAERSAGRAGVAMTAPLGLCFLPAFLCLGLAPVVVGLLSTLHLF